MGYTTIRVGPRVQKTERLNAILGSVAPQTPLFDVHFSSMIAAPIYDPAIQIARMKPRDQRTDCARSGMVGALTAFQTNSVRWGANRKADGLGPIDQAVAFLRNNWVAQGGAGPVNDGAVTTVLTTCKNWLEGRKVFGMRTTGWREASIAELYWRTAWCYCCDNYVQRALQQLGVNNAAGNPTTVTGPVAGAAPVGTPYQFLNSGYSHHSLPQPPRVLRGDSRGPLSIQGANGFQPLMNGRWTYAPWFDGNATGGTQSVTTQEALAIEAGPASHATHTNAPEGQLPAWLAGVLQNATGQNNPQRRGYVYHFGNLGNAMSSRVEDGAIGTEHIFLALPATLITSWWVVLVNRQTVGPFPFPPGAVAPPAVNLSAPRQLA